jgi:hypothetical protein
VNILNIGLKFVCSRSMKHFKFLFLFSVLFALFFCNPETVCAQDVRDSQGRLTGRWLGNDYRDAQGKLLYRMDNTGSVRDAQGRLVIRCQGGDVRDSHGRLLGRVLTVGDVRDSQGRLLGRITENGDVRDAQGRLLGRSSGVSMERAAVTWFFFP